MLTKFSEAISSSPSCWRLASLAMARAMSGSDSESGRDIQEFFMTRILLASGWTWGVRSVQHGWQITQFAHQPGRLLVARIARADGPAEESACLVRCFACAFCRDRKH